jgi:hypothetical protein
VHENKKLANFVGVTLDRVVSSSAECLQWCFEVGPKTCAAYQYTSQDGRCELYNGIHLRKVNLVDQTGSIFVEVLGKCEQDEEQFSDDRVKRAAAQQAYGTW